MEIKGLNIVISNLRKYGVEASKDIEAVTEQVARNIEKNAKVNSNASADLGKLGQSIIAVKADPTNWIVNAWNFSTLRPIH